jgi:hypothetical protein
MAKPLTPRNEETKSPIQKEPAQSRSASPKTIFATDKEYFDDAVTATASQVVAKKLKGTPILKHSRSSSLLEHRIPRKSSLGSIQSAAQHQRMLSESSILNRGRPMKRGEIFLQRGTTRNVKMGMINGSFSDLPKGYKRTQLNDSIPTEELYGLRRDAEEQTVSHNILNQKQIAGLNQVRKFGLFLNFTGQAS